MERIDFSLQDNYDPDLTGKVIAIHIDQRPLIDRIRDVELPMATAEGHPGIAGDYMGIPRIYMSSPKRHFLGHPDHENALRDVFENYEIDDRIPILMDTSADLPSWPLLVRVRFSPLFVTWQDFLQGSRLPTSPSVEDGLVKPWNYGCLRYTFNRQQYEAALDELERTPFTR